MPPSEKYKSEIGIQPTMCQVHTGAHVSILAPGKTDYTACHQRKKGSTYILHVVPITTQVTTNMSQLEKKETKKRKEDAGKRKKIQEERKNEKEQERKEKTRQEEEARKGKKKTSVTLADPRN